MIRGGFRHLREGGLLAPLALVAGFGVVLGGIAWTTFVGPGPVRYPVAWRAPWIVLPGSPITQTYFRKKLYLSEPPRRAWIKVVAPNTYTLYVNGEPVGGEKSVLRNVTGFHDITAKLLAGTNVIGFDVEQSTYRGRARLAVEGEFEGWHGIRTPIASDTTWKAAPYRQRQPDGGPAWFDIAFDDTTWPKAVTAGTPGPADYSAVPKHPWVFTGGFEGHWVWAPQAAADKVYFRHRLEVPGGARVGWFRVVTSVGFSLVINGVPVAEHKGPADEALPAPRLHVSAYDVTRFLRAGPNVIGVKAYTKRAERRLYLDGLVTDGDGRDHLFATSPEWKAAVSPSGDWAARGYDDSAWSPAVTVARVMPGDGPLSEGIQSTDPPETYRLVRLGLYLGILVLGALAAIALWYLGAAARRRIRGVELNEALGQQAPAFALAVGILLAALLVRYDYRFDPAFPYRAGVILAGLAVLIGAQLLLVFERRSDPPADDAREPSPARRGPWGWSFVRRHRYALPLGLLLLVGFALRYSDVNFEPLGPDESTAMLSVQGILERGYPSYRISELMPGRESHSSEIVGYPKALAIVFLGPTELAARLPAVIFGMLTILVIFLLGRALFDTRVAAVAAVAFALLPAAISFTHYSRYPSQLTLFSTLTVYLFYRAIASERSDPRFVYWATAAAVVTYVSWEGVAFLLPGLLMGLLAYRRNLRWLGDKHLWIALGIVTLVIFFQQSARIINQADRMSLGSGLTDISVGPLWLYPQYDPLVYFHNLLFTKNLQVISVAMLLGLLLCWRDRRFTYLNAVLVTPLFLTTNVLETQEFRHVYYTVPLLILSGTKTVFLVLDHVLPLGRVGGRLGISLRRAAEALLVILLLLTANDYVLKLYNMPGYANPSTWLGVGDDLNMRGASAYVAAHMAPGDAVIARQPTWTYWYLKQVDFFIKEATDIPAAVAEKVPLPVHRKSGVLLVSSAFDLQQVLNKTSSAWIVSNTNLGGLDPDSIEFVNQKLKLVYEDLGVGVYRWQK